MNAFYEHHQSSIEFVYRGFDRILLNGLIQPFQQPQRVLGFFNTDRDGSLISITTSCGGLTCVPKWIVHSLRSAAMGSTFAARRAGM
jgi:hypothetical protein